MLDERKSCSNAAQLRAIAAHEAFLVLMRTQFKLIHVKRVHESHCACRKSRLHSSASLLPVSTIVVDFFLFRFHATFSHS